MVKQKFTGKKENGKFVFVNRDIYARFMDSVPEGQDLEMTIGKKWRQRSIKQNAYYWSAVLPIIAADTGHTVEELHEVFKGMFLPKKIIDYRGKETAIDGSTPEQGTIEFTAYLENIRAEAASMGINIPDPTTVTY
jgi:hypothetical protein